MATEITKKIVSDLSGKTPAETVRVSFNGRTVDVDVTETERKKIEDVFQPLIDVGREVIAVPMAKRSGKPRKDTAAVREWAKANGFKVGDRGRIPPEVWEAYENRV